MPLTVLTESLHSHTELSHSGEPTASHSWFYGITIKPSMFLFSLIDDTT